MKVTAKIFNVTFSRSTGRAKVEGSARTFKMTEVQILDWAAHTRACGHTVNLKFL